MSDEEKVGINPITREEVEKALDEGTPGWEALANEYYHIQIKHAETFIEEVKDVAAKTRKVHPTPVGITVDGNILASMLNTLIHYMQVVPSKVATLMREYINKEMKFMIHTEFDHYFKREFQKIREMLK